MIKSGNGQGRKIRVEMGKRGTVSLMLDTMYGETNYFGLRNTNQEAMLDVGNAYALTILTKRMIHTKNTHHYHDADAVESKLLDGRLIASAWQQEMVDKVQKIEAQGGRTPGLGVILVGHRLDSHVYVMRKEEACRRVGIFSTLKYLPENVSQIGIRQAVKSMCADPRIDGILVQLPLPRHIDEEDVIEHFDPGKDVDGFHPLNVGRTLMRGRTARFVPCTALGCIELLRRSKVDFEGKSVVIVGDSNIVGMPLAMLFRDEGTASVTVVHRSSYSGVFSVGPQGSLGKQGTPRVPHPSDGVECIAGDDIDDNDPPHPYQVTYCSSQRKDVDTLVVAQKGSTMAAHEVEDMASVARTADILVIAVGFPQLVTADWIKPGAIVVDVGINVVDWNSPQGKRDDDCEPCGHDHTVASSMHGDKDHKSASSSSGRLTTHIHEDHSHPFHVVGDVDFESVKGKASAITPVPGGIGPMTIAALLHNTIKSAAWRLGVNISPPS
eukprot:jgi/Picsp_1/218/NSC_00217-R1_-methylenetetrahydrofolate dehydrogenase